MPDELKNTVSNLSIDDCRKYTQTTASHIKSIDDISKLGLIEHPWSIKDNSRGYKHILTINEAEEKIVKPGDWEYLINRYNFREQWNFETTNPKIGFFGCSFTFGEGIEYQDTFVNIVSKELNLNPFNFGIGGSSIHRIAKTFTAVTKVIDLDYAVFTFPAHHRQLYINDEGKLINLIPYWPHRSFKEISEKLTEIDEDFYILQATSYINWINDIAENKKVKIILSSWHYPLNLICKDMYPELTIDRFPFMDMNCARDKVHPGVLSHKAHAKQIIKAFYDRTWI